MYNLVVHAGFRIRSDLWLPASVGLLGMLTSLGAWWALVVDRRAQLVRATATAASDVRLALEDKLAAQLDTLEGLAELSSTLGFEPEAVWRVNVLRAMEPVDGLSAIAWRTPGRDEPRIAAFADGDPRLVSRLSILSHIDGASSLDSPELVGPERDAAGRPSYRVVLPRRPAEERRTPEHDAHAQMGVLVAMLDATEVLQSALRAQASGYAIRVQWGDTEMFARDAPTTSPSEDWWVVQQQVDLPFDAKWQLSFRPTAELAAARLTPLPNYLFLAGLVLSMVLALLSHQLRIIRMQARGLAESNRALEQRRAELESGVEERTVALKEAVDELEAFNYSVSHDLRSPLGAILNFTAILEEDYDGLPLDAQGIEFLGRIRHSATRATLLLEDLLQLSRARSAPLHLEPIDMAELARETFAQTRAAQPEGQVEFVVDPALPRATGDRVLLGTLLANLFSNSLKYSQRVEKRRIRVEGRIEGRECVYTISDNGEGFDMRFADKLFGLFERLHGQEDVAGTGVGLALVARITRRHGGRVWAEGTPGQGARFSFTILEPGAA